MERLKKYKEFNESKNNEYVSLSKDEKDFLWSKMESRKKSKANQDKNIVYRQLIENEKISNEEEFIIILNSLEYSVKKRVKDNNVIKGKYSEAFKTLQDKLPDTWLGVKYSSLKAKEKRDNNLPTKNKTKKEILDWLKKNNIVHDENKTKKELLDKIKKQFNEDN